jgi:agmatinase
MEIFDVPEKGSGRSIVVFGAPYDASTIYRRGSAQAPAAIRAASVSIETFSLRLRRDLSCLNLRDVGDLPLEGQSPMEALERVAEVARAILAEDGVPVMIGGEHTMSLGVVRALHERFPHLNVVIVDAHFDLRDEWEGAKINHATWARRASECLEPGALHFLGVRSATQEELAFCEAGKVFFSLQSPGDLLSRLKPETPVYFSIDYDGLDPSVFPATGNPEPLGLAVSDLLSVFRGLAGYNVVGIDFVEYNPELDRGTSAVVAAWLIREALLEIFGGGSR